MVSRTTRYALEVLRCLASDTSRRVPVTRLSLQTGIPSRYLASILARLRRHDIVEGAKGWRGGFRLRQEALGHPIRTIADIFESRQAREMSEGCVFGLRRCDGARPCALHAQWERILEAREALLATNTVRDLLGSEVERRPGGPEPR